MIASIKVSFRDGNWARIDLDGNPYEWVTRYDLSEIKTISITEKITVEECRARYGGDMPLNKRTIESLEVQTTLALNTLRDARNAMLSAARICDDWARESQSGGWSTHQVQANRNHADYLRREADKASRVIEELS